MDNNFLPEYYNENMQSLVSTSLQSSNSSRLNPAVKSLTGASLPPAGGGLRRPDAPHRRVRQVAAM